ncbi:hypothetical protein ILUMI_04942 [Ignelater luminosus]|uniref:DDE Tnp4 domain-containing protein n=1 Tax=Ignelater luminosus TaxID=2038154 RepID=A0A8K0GE23_IGNLU|nr:hypothetical protein ILUMI_04942 [Ignelater luminosus]
MTLLSQFVPNNRGYQHKTRIQIQNHTVPVFNGVFGQPPTSVPVVFDCRNVRLYRETSRPRTSKEDIVGSQEFKPLQGDDRLSLMLKNPVMLSFFQPGDYVVVDRGFCDVVDETKSHGIEVYIPNLLKHGKQQFTCSESNEPCKVTALRFIVETVNSILKNVFKFLSGRMEAAYGPAKFWNFFHICCAILNKYYGPILTDKPRYRIVVEAYHSRLQVSNKLEQEIQKKNVSARSSSQWIRINLVNLPEFPILTMDNLLDITLGPYQLKQTDYYNNRINEEPNIFLYKIEEGLIRVKYPSRYSREKTHHVWIRFKSKDGFALLKPVLEHWVAAATAHL